MPLECLLYATCIPRECPSAPLQNDDPIEEESPAGRSSPAFIPPVRLPPPRPCRAHSTRRRRLVADCGRELWESSRKMGEQNGRAKWESSRKMGRRGRNGSPAADVSGHFVCSQSILYAWSAREEADGGGLTTPALTAKRRWRGRVSLTTAARRPRPTPTQCRTPLRGYPHRPSVSTRLLVC